MRKAATRILLMIIVLFAALWAGNQFVWAALPYEPRFTWGYEAPTPEDYTFRLYCAEGGAEPSADGSPVVEAPWSPNGDGTSSWQAPRLQFGPGDWTCALTAVDAQSRESALSNPVSFSVPLPAPTNLIVE